MKASSGAWIAGALIVATGGLSYAAGARAHHQGTPAPTTPAVVVQACPVGTTTGTVTWSSDEPGQCIGTTEVPGTGVTISYIRNSDGTTLMSWTYRGACGDAGLDSGGSTGAAGWFGDVDC